MKANVFLRKIFLTEYTDKGHTVDRIIAGNGEKEITRVATCMVITPSVLRAAAEWGADLVVAHEPTFFKDEEEFRPHAPYIMKRDLIAERDMVVCRWHDSPHYGDVDYVSLAFINRMGWKGSFDGKFIFIFDEPRSPLDIAKDIRDRIGIKHPRIIGRRDGEVRKVSVQLGQRSSATFLEMLSNDVDLAVAGEICEWLCGEPVRDMSEIGMQKSLILLGHVGSERDAMADLADRINSDFSGEGITARYFDCGELYSYID